MREVVKYATEAGSPPIWIRRLVPEELQPKLVRKFASNVHRGVEPLYKTDARQAEMEQLMSMGHEYRMGYVGESPREDVVWGAMHSAPNPDLPFLGSWGWYKRHVGFRVYSADVGVTPYVNTEGVAAAMLHDASQSSAARGLVAGVQGEYHIAWKAGIDPDIRRLTVGGLRDALEARHTWLVNANADATGK